MMKLIHNFVCGVQAASLAEAMAMIDAAGLERARAVSILTEGAPGSGIVKRVASRAAANDFDPNFTLRLMTKDLIYAENEASAKGIQLKTASSALELFRQALATGHGEEDFSAVTKAVKRD